MAFACRPVGGAGGHCLLGAPSTMCFGSGRPAAGSPKCGRQAQGDSCLRRALLGAGPRHRQRPAAAQQRGAAPAALCHVRPPQAAGAAHDRGRDGRRAHQPAGGAGGRWGGGARRGAVAATGGGRGGSTWQCTSGQPACKGGQAGRRRRCSLSLFQPSAPCLGPSQADESIVPQAEFSLDVGSRRQGAPDQR